MRPTLIVRKAVGSVHMPICTRGLVSPTGIHDTQSPVGSSLLRPNLMIKHIKFIRSDILQRNCLVCQENIVISSLLRVPGMKLPLAQSKIPKLILFLNPSFLPSWVKFPYFFGKITSI